MLLSSGFAAAETINADGGSSVVLVCEHAANAIPPSLGDLGLDPAGRVSHAAWDIGARDLACAISARLDAPLVASTVSRLVYDCNRPPESASAIPAKSELVDVPGNRDLSDAERDARVRQVYEPFRIMLAGLLDRRAASQPVLVTVHSFTPVYFGQPRQVQIGLLHDQDDRLARAMLASADPGYATALNAPYDATDGVTHTLRVHALPRGLLNVMIEVRNDLLEHPEGVQAMSRTLCAMIEAGLAACGRADAVLPSVTERREA